MLTLEDCRAFYAQEVRFTAISSAPELVEAYARVPREKFLGPAPWQISSPEARALSMAGLRETSYVTVNDPRDLYHNVVVVLDREKGIHNGQPSALASWIDALALQPGDRAFHLGCGVGYYTAIIAEVVGPSGSVVALELQSDLAARAKENLASYTNVTVHQGDGAAFDPGPCDAMFVNCGVTHPQTIWLERLRDGGRLVVPFTMAVSPQHGQGVMTKILRQLEWLLRRYGHAHWHVFRRQPSRSRARTIDKESSHNGRSAQVEVRPPRRARARRDLRPTRRRSLPQ